MNALITKDLHNVDEKALSMTMDTMVSRHESGSGIFEQWRNGATENMRCGCIMPVLAIDDIIGQENKDEKIKTIINELSSARFDFEKAVF